MGMQANVGEQPNRGVCARESRLGADRLDLRIGNETRGGFEQPLYRLRSRRELALTHIVACTFSQPFR